MSVWNGWTALQGRRFTWRQHYEHRKILKYINDWKDLCRHKVRSIRLLVNPGESSYVKCHGKPLDGILGLVRLAISNMRALTSWNEHMDMRFRTNRVSWWCKNLIRCRGLWKMETWCLKKMMTRRGLWNKKMLEQAQAEGSVGVAWNNIAAEEGKLRYGDKRRYTQLLSH